MAKRDEIKRKKKQQRQLGGKLEGETIGAINDRNEAFNRKIKREFDKYTVEIRQNLERGTAL